MSVSPISPSLVNKIEIHHPTPVVEWEKFDFEVFHESVPLRSIDNTAIICQRLRDTHLSCDTHTQAGNWENRKVFIETILKDIHASCPSDEPFVFISFGSGRLLMEYVLGKMLIEKGFCHLSFILIDPIYKFSNENKPLIQSVLRDFRKKIESDYLRVNGINFPKENIQYVSRGQNIAKYFSPGANVLLIESLPPYTTIIKEIQSLKLQEKNAQDFILGSQIVPLECANAMACVPAQTINDMNWLGVKIGDYVPFFATPTSKGTLAYTDWGCKIDSNGTYYLNFPDHTLIKKDIETRLAAEIENIQQGDPRKDLTQENLSALLKIVESILTTDIPRVRCIYSADYTFDLRETMRYIRSNAGHHYRKGFTLKADYELGYKICCEQI